MTFCDEESASDILNNESEFKFAYMILFNNAK